MVVKLDDSYMGSLVLDTNYQILPTARTHFIPLRIFPQLYDVVKNSVLPVGIVSELFCQRRSHQTLESSVTGSTA